MAKQLNKEKFNFIKKLELQFCIYWAFNTDLSKSNHSSEDDIFREADKLYQEDPIYAGYINSIQLLKYSDQ